MNLKDPIELRANMYAVETQFDDEKILEFIGYGYTAKQIAMETGTFTNYIGMKMTLLRYKGYPVNEYEYSPDIWRVAEGKENGSDYWPC